MKKLTGLFFAVLLILTFTACGNNTSDISVKVGNTVKIGEIDWLVLSVGDNKALVLSENVLEKRAYHSPDIDITWEYCELREYLNGSFYDKTFNDTEKKNILTTKTINSDNPEFSTSGGNDTSDKIFLLSISEINEYMGNNAHENIKNSMIARHINTDETSWWWLRSPGIKNDFAAIVNSDGNVYAGGGGDGVGMDSGGVRPALWLNL